MSHHYGGFSFGNTRQPDYNVCMHRKTLFAFLSLACLTSCQSKEVTYYSVNAWGTFHSFCNITYDSPTVGEIKQELIDLCVRLSNLTDPYVGYVNMNNVFTINQTNDPVEVDEDLYALLKQSWELKEKTDGYFNPLVGKLTNNWKNALYGGITEVPPDYVPTPERIEEAKKRAAISVPEIEASYLAFDDDAHTVQRVGGALLDLGGVAKGFAVERIESRLKEIASTSYLINAGTSSLGMGIAQGGGHFNVRINYMGDTILRYKAKNIDCSTSAVYEQSVEMDGTIYSHIINPKTGLPVTSLSMAFLQGDDSIFLDAMSTSCMLAGVEQTKVWEERYHFKAALFENEKVEGVNTAKLIYENKGLEHSS